MQHQSWGRNYTTALESRWDHLMRHLGKREGVLPARNQGVSHHLEVSVLLSSWSFPPHTSARSKNRTASCTTPSLSPVYNCQAMRPDERNWQQATTPRHPPTLSLSPDFSTCTLNCSARQCMQGGGSGSPWVVIGRVTTSLAATQRSKPTDASHCLVAARLHAHDAVFTKFHSIFRNG